MYNTKKILITLVLTFLFGSISLTAYSANKAKDSYSTFGVQPAKVEFDGSVTNRQEAEVLVINFSDHPIVVNVLLSDFIFTNDPKHLYIFDETNKLPVSAIPYIDVAPKKFEIPAKSRKSIKISYNSDKKITSGKYSAVLFQVEGKIKTGKVALDIAGRISSTVFITPGKGSISRKGHINDFKAKSSLGLARSFFGLSKAPGFVISFKNTGNTHLNLRGQVLIENIFGKTVQTIKLPDYEVYPNSTRDIEIPWTVPLIGFFKAKVQANSFLYDYKKLEMSKKSGFFYIPYQYIVGLFLAIVAAFIYFLFKHSKAKKATPSID